MLLPEREVKLCVERSFLDEKRSVKMKKNKEGYYRTTFSVIDMNGKRKRIELYDKDKKNLEKRLIEKKLEYEKGLLIINGKSTVERWATEWLKTYKLGKIATGTYEDYKQKVNNIIIPAIGSLQISEVKQYNLQQILNAQNCSKSKGKKIKNTIEQIFKTAVANGLINKDPSIGLTLPRLSEGERRSVTDEERTAILKAAEYHRAGLWIKIMLYCGLRPSEAIVLDWSDVDIREKQINVNKALEKATGKIKPPKTKAGYRIVPIPDILLQDLKAAKGIGLIFTQPTTKKQHTATSMRCMWESFKKSVDIEMGAEVYRNKIIASKVADDLTAYCLRHTYCTDLQNAGVPINVAKYLMGHSNIQVTANIYTHHTGKASSEALNAINAYYAG